MSPFFQDSLTTLYCGDSRVLMAGMPQGLVVTDPPFNVGYPYAGYKDKLKVADYADLLLKSCRLPCVVVHYPEDICQLSISLGKAPQKMVAWVYPSNTARQHRCIAWWGCKPDLRKDGQPYRNPSDKRIQKRMAQGKMARLYDWWQVNQVKNVNSDKTSHPCQMPIEVMRRIIKITDCKLVIDPFAGSGTTLLAARQLGIPVIGIEQDESYCQIIRRRILDSETIFDKPPS